MYVGTLLGTGRKTTHVVADEPVNVCVVVHEPHMSVTHDADLMQIWTYLLLIISCELVAFD